MGVGTVHVICHIAKSIGLSLHQRSASLFLSFRAHMDANLQSTVRCEHSEATM